MKQMWTIYLVQCAFESLFDSSHIPLDQILLGMLTRPGKSDAKAEAKAERKL